MAQFWAIKPIHKNKQLKKNASSQSRLNWLPIHHYRWVTTWTVLPDWWPHFVALGLFSNRSKLGIQYYCPNPRSLNPPCETSITPSLADRKVNEVKLFPGTGSRVRPWGHGFLVETAPVLKNTHQFRWLRSSISPDENKLIYLQCAFFHRMKRSREREFGLLGGEAE